jgi:hypothetical protein
MQRIESLDDEATDICPLPGAPACRFPSHACRGFVVLLAPWTERSLTLATGDFIGPEEAP